MSSKKFKTHCTILKYLEDNDPEMAMIIERSCSNNLLNARYTTFLNPIDKAYRKKVIELLQSDQVHEVHQGVDMIRVCIIRNIFKQPTDWLAQKDDIPNGLYPSQHTEVDTVAAGKDVVFKSGARATLDPDFRDSSQLATYAVWKLTGTLPITNDKPSNNKYRKLHKKMANASASKEGAYDPGNYESQSMRFKIAIAVENAYALHEQTRRSVPNTPQQNIFLMYTLSLLHHIKKLDMNLLKKVVGLLGFNQIDFYILLEPHRRGIDPLIPDTVIQDWWANKELGHTDTREFESMITGDRSRLLGMLDSVRKEVNKQIDARPRSCATIIEDVYKALESSNSIKIPKGEMSDILSDELYTYYRTSPGLKLIHDELRYIAHHAFKRLQAAQSFMLTDYETLLNVIGDYLYAATAEDRAKVRKLVNEQTIKLHINPSELIQECKTFVDSTCFLHIAMTEEEASGIKRRNTTSKPTQFSGTLYNIQKDTYQQHRRLLSSAGDNKDILIAIRSLDPATISDDLREEIRNKFK